MPKKILVIDDAEMQRIFYQGILKGEGFETLIVDSCESALEQLDQFSPDLIILDLLLPKMSGVELLNELKTRGYSGVSLVASADIQETVRNNCISLGAAGFIEKPLSKKDLVEKINRTLLSEEEDDQIPEISPDNLNILLELCNKGMISGAEKLKVLLNKEITLSTQNIVLVGPEEISKSLSMGEKDYIGYKMDYSGTYSGTSALLMPRNSLNEIVSEASGIGINEARFNGVLIDFMMEISNITLNSILGTVSNQLSLSLDYKVPQPLGSSLEGLFEDKEKSPEKSKAILVTTIFKFADIENLGEIIFLMSHYSLKKLNIRLEEYAKRNAP